MPIVPGVPGAGLPVAPMDALSRRIQEIERRLDEFLPAVMAAVGPAISDLQTQQTTLTNQQTTLTNQQTQLTSTVNDLQSRVTQTVAIASFNSGTLPNDATFHAYGSSIPITIAVPTGSLVVTVGCGQATLNSGGGGAVQANATFSISGGVASMNAYASSAYLASTNTGIGAPLAVTREFSVTPGTYTITAQMYAWASGTTGASVNFQQPYLTVQVTG